LKDSLTFLACDDNSYSLADGWMRGHILLKYRNPCEVIPRLMSYYASRHLQWELATDHRFLN